LVAAMIRQFLLFFTSSGNCERFQLRSSFGFFGSSRLVTCRSTRFAAMV
jgi:hypothetical protein